MSDIAIGQIPKTNIAEKDDVLIVSKLYGENANITKTITTEDLAKSLDEFTNTTLTEVSHGTIGSAFVMTGEYTMYKTFVVAARYKGGSAPWMYTLTTAGSNAGLSFFYDTSYYWSLSFRFNSDGTFTYVNGWTGGKYGTKNIVATDFEVYIYGVN